MTMRGVIRGMAFAVSLLSVGCGATVVRSGLPAGRPPDAYDERWHHGFIFGLVDASGPYDLREICPLGWSEMRVTNSVLGVFLQSVTIGIYTPSSVTIICAKTASDPPDAAGEGPLSK